MLQGTQNFVLSFFRILKIKAGKNSRLSGIKSESSQLQLLRVEYCECQVWILWPGVARTFFRGSFFEEGRKMFGLFENNLTPSIVISYTSIAFDVKWIIKNKESLFRRNKLRGLCFSFLSIKTHNFENRSINGCYLSVSNPFCGIFERSIIENRISYLVNQFRKQTFMNFS